MNYRGGRGGRFRGRGGRGRGARGGDAFYEDRRGSKRQFGDNNGYDRDNAKQFREDREEIHPDLLGLKNFLSQMKGHWKTQKMDKEEEEILIANVLKQTLGKEELLTKSESYHLNCNVAEFLARTTELPVMARFMRAFNTENVEPRHRTVKIFEALVDSAIDYFRSPEKFDAAVADSDDEGGDQKSIDYRAIFARWLHCLGLFVVDNIERFFYEETLFTQRILCLLCGKKFSRDLHGAVDPETTAISDEMTALRDRFFDYLTKNADLDTLMNDKQARFIVALSVNLASALDQKKVLKRFMKHIFGENAESILTNPDSFIVVDSVLRHAGRFGLAAKCSHKVLDLFESIAQNNPGIVTGLFAGLQDKDEFVELYEKLADKWTLDILTKNAAVASACARFDMKQNDYLDKLFACMTEKDKLFACMTEQNFIFLVRNLGLGPTFKVICGFKANQRVLKALDDLTSQELFNLACSSHVHLLESVVSSETIGEKIKMKMISKLLEKVEQLAVDKFGSRFLDAVMVNCQVKTIKVVATELIKHKKMLLGDRIGKFIFLHWGLKYFEDSNKDAWNNVISNSKDRKRQKLSSLLTAAT